MMRRLLFVAALGLSSAVAQGQGTILFRMNYAASAWPLAGWPNAEPTSSRWSRQHLVGAGPHGQNVAQLTELPTQPGTGQHDWGWDGNIVPALAQGGTRFFRWRHRVTAASNCAATPSNKLLIIGQGCQGGRCRVIVQPKCQPNGRIQYNFQVDGGTYQVETGYVYPRGEWLHVQLEVKTSSTLGANDGALREWINTNAQASPTIRNEGIRLDALNAQYVIFGGYNNTENVPASATNVQQYTDFEIGTAFDPAWHQTEATPPAPLIPTSLHIVR